MPTEDEYGSITSAKSWNEGELLVWSPKVLRFSAEEVRKSEEEILNSDKDFEQIINTHVATDPIWPRNIAPDEWYFLWSRMGSLGLGRQSVIRDFDNARNQLEDRRFDIKDREGNWLIVTELRAGIGYCRGASLDMAIVVFISLLRRFMLEKKIESKEGLPDEDCFSHELVAVLQKQQSDLRDLLSEHLRQVKAVSTRAIQSRLGNSTLAPLRDAIGTIKGEALEFVSELEEELKDMSGPPLSRSKYSFRRLSHVLQLNHVAEVAATSRTRAKEILRTLLSGWVGLRFQEKTDSIAFTHALQRALKQTQSKLSIDGQPCTITFQHSGRSNSFKFKQGGETVATFAELPELHLSQKM